MMGLLKALADGADPVELTKRGGTVTLLQITELEKQLVRLRKMAEHVAKHGEPHKHDKRAWKATGKAVDDLFRGFEEDREFAA